MNDKKCSQGHLYISRQYPGGSWSGCLECKRLRSQKSEYKLKKQKSSLEWRKKNNTYYSEYYKNNVSRVYWRNIFTFYGLSKEQFELKINQQNGLCAVCKFQTAKFYVDHDHSCCPNKKSCGKCVRGLLCQPCNTLLGACKDNTNTLHFASEYLTAYKDIKNA